MKSNQQLKAEEKRAAEYNRMRMENVERLHHINGRATIIHQQPSINLSIIKLKDLLK